MVRKLPSAISKCYLTFLYLKRQTKNAFYGFLKTKNGKGNRNDECEKERVKCKAIHHLPFHKLHHFKVIKITGFLVSACT